MLDDFGADDEVERCFAESFEDARICSHDLEPALRVRGSRERDPLLAQVQTNDIAAEFDEFAAGVAITTADIQDTRAWRQIARKREHMRHEPRVHVRSVGMPESVIAVTRRCLHPTILVETPVALQELAAVNLRRKCERRIRSKMFCRLVALFQFQRFRFSVSLWFIRLIPNPAQYGRRDQSRRTSGVGCAPTPQPHESIPRDGPNAVSHRRRGGSGAENLSAREDRRCFVAG